MSEIIKIAKKMQFNIVPPQKITLEHLAKRIVLFLPMIYNILTKLSTHEKYSQRIQQNK